MENDILTIHVYDPYEGFPFNQAYASLDEQIYDDADVEHKVVRIRVPDAHLFQVVKNRYGDTLLAFERGDCSSEPFPATCNGHFTGTHVTFCFGNGSVSCPVVQDAD